MTEKQMFEEMLQKQGLEIRKLRSDLKKAQHELKIKENRISEAMGFIRWICFNSCRSLTIDECNKVYYILKGDDEE